MHITILDTNIEQKRETIEISTLNQVLKGVHLTHEIWKRILFAKVISHLVLSMKIIMIVYSWYKIKFHIFLNGESKI